MGKFPEDLALQRNVQQHSGVIGRQFIPFKPVENAATEVNKYHKFVLYFNIFSAASVRPPIRPPNSCHSLPAPCCGNDQSVSLSLVIRLTAVKRPCFQ